MTARAPANQEVTVDRHTVIPAIFGIPLLPSRRFWVVDPGARAFKVLLIDHRFGRMRVLKHAKVPRASGDLAQFLSGWHDFPIAAALPQADCLSQVVDLTGGDSGDVDTQIENEVARLSGLSDRSIQFHYTPLRPFDSFQNPFWITLCKEEATTRQLAALQREPEDLAGLTTAANALLAAHRALHPERTNVILADVGTESTTIAIERDRQGVFAVVLSVGADSFPPADPETNSENESPDLAAYDLWLRQLTSCLTEIDEPRTLPRDVVRWPVILSGGGALEPAFRAHLDRREPDRFELWSGADADPDLPGNDARGPLFAVAFGAAVQATHRTPKSVSMLPHSARQGRRQMEQRRSLESLTLFALLIATVVLIAGIIRQWDQVRASRASLDRTNVLLERVSEADQIRKQLQTDYEFVRPIADLKRRTSQTLETLFHLQQIRGQHSFFVVLFADVKSYFPPIAAPVRAEGSVFRTATNTTPAVAATSRAPFSDGFIAELCIPESGSALRSTLSEIVAELGEAPWLLSVDSLPTDLQRRWVDSDVTLSNRCFTLALEVAASAISHPPPRQTRRTTSGNRPASDPPR